MKSYVTLESDGRVYPVTYELGPVVETWPAVAVGWYRNSFRPGPIGATGTLSASGVQIGDGQVGQFDQGSYAKWSSPSDVTLAIPDEMKSSPVPPRTLEIDKSMLVFYGGASAPLVAGRSGNTLTLAAGHGLFNGQLVTVRSSGTLPAGLAPMTLYYVRARTSTSIELALSPGAAAVTITDAGTGVHEVLPLTRVGVFDMADKPAVCSEKPTF
jgi:hypothetical protein